MADVHLSMRCTLGADVTSHFTETLADPELGVVPTQMRWGDLHPGLKILLPGSPSAEEGEINWENTLGGKFAHAMKQLEGLYYVVWGAPVDYTNHIQWREMPSPRCFWGGETWKPLSCDDYGNTWHYEVHQTVAVGGTVFGHAKPTVPIRSISNEPAYQFATKQHHGVFPFGSVTRTGGDAGIALDHNGQPTFDPISTTVFPNTTDDNGTALEAEDVTITWTPIGITPNELKTIKLHTWINGSWFTQDATWNEAESRYEWTIEAQPHNTTVEWMIEVVLDDDEDTTVFEPQMETVSQADAYSFNYFTHYCRYPHGIPEANDTYGGQPLRVSTDYYRFDGSETISCELINLCRFAIDALMSWTHKDAFHHNPRLRSSSDGSRCWKMPIRFRWSGANGFPHYVVGGKTSDGKPLHNGPGHEPPAGEAWGSTLARKSWRGIDLLYRYNDFAGYGSPHENYEYGGGVSWEVWPEEFILDYHETKVPTPLVKERYWNAGLQEGDVIDAVHIIEIIEAINYLVTEGLWHTTDVYTTVWTVPDYMGYELGYLIDWQHLRESEKYHDPDFIRDRWVIFNEMKCCKESWGEIEHWIEDKLYNGGTDLSNDNCDGHERGCFCDPWPTPTYNQCWYGWDNVDDNDDPINPNGRGSHAKCNLYIEMSESHNGWYDEGDPEDPDDDTYWFGYNKWLQVYRRDQSDPNPRYCGDAWKFQSCFPEGHECGNPDYPSEVLSDTNSAEYRVSIMGWAAYVCTPPTCEKGPDDSHGNGILLSRYDHQCINGPNMVTQWMSMGNCHGDILGIGEAFTPTGQIAPDEFWFQTLSAHRYDGAATNWIWSQLGSIDDLPGAYDACDQDWSAEPFPELPGLGEYLQDGVTPICEIRIDEPGPCNVGCGTTQHCACTTPTEGLCDGYTCWVAINLNLDNTNRPYGNFRGRYGDLSPYTRADGEMIPILKDYNLYIENPQPDGCPCESEGNGSACG